VKKWKINLLCEVGLTRLIYVRCASNPYSQTLPWQ